MMMGRTVALAFALMLMSAASAGAQDDFARNGFFIGIAAEMAWDTFESEWENDIEDGIASADLNMEGSPGLNGRVGYRFHPHVSAELEVEWLAELDGVVSWQPPEPNPDPDPTTDVDRENIAEMRIDAWTITANAKGYLLTGRHQPYVLLGMGVMTADVEFNALNADGAALVASDRETGFATRFGGGIEVYMTEKSVLTLGTEYVLPTGDTKDLDYFSVLLGYQHRF